jgi:hypothetical protein
MRTFNLHPNIHKRNKKYTATTIIDPHERHVMIYDFGHGMGWDRIGTRDTTGKKD